MELARREQVLPVILLIPACAAQPEVDLEHVRIGLSDQFGCADPLQGRHVKVQESQCADLSLADLAAQGVPGGAESVRRERALQHVLPVVHTRSYWLVLGS